MKKITINIVNSIVSINTAELKPISKNDNSEKPSDNKFQNLLSNLRNEENTNKNEKKYLNNDRNLNSIENFDEEENLHLIPLDIISKEIYELNKLEGGQSNLIKDEEYINLNDIKNYNSYPSIDMQYFKIYNSNIGENNSLTLEDINGLQGNLDSKNIELHSNIGVFENTITSIDEIRSITNIKDITLKYSDNDTLINIKKDVFNNKPIAVIKLTSSEIKTNKIISIENFFTETEFSFSSKFNDILHNNLEEQKSSIDKLNTIINNTNQSVIDKSLIKKYTPVSLEFSRRENLDNGNSNKTNQYIVRKGILKSSNATENSFYFAQNNNIDDTTFDNKKVDIGKLENISESSYNFAHKFNTEISKKNNIEFNNQTKLFSKEIIRDNIVKSFSILNKNEQFKEMKMKLNPDNLGEITVKLISEKGQLTGEIISNNAETFDIILENINELKNEINNKGSNVIEIKTSLQLDVKNHSGNNEKENNKDRNKISKKKKSTTIDESITTGDVSQGKNKNNINTIDLFI